MLTEYMRWAKLRPVPRYDLAGSNLLHCELDDLPGALDHVALTGWNPDGDPALIEAIARRYITTPECVAVAPGAAGANFLAFAALLEPGDDVLFERPGYDPIVGALRLLGANVIRFEREFDEAYALDPDRVAAALTARTRLIVVTSPHNPSGALASADALSAVGRLAERAGAHVVVDEVYLDSVYEDRPPPAATLSDVFVSTNSLTKAYGLSGLRCGWVIGTAAVAARARRVRDFVDGSGPFLTERLGLLAFEQLERLEARARGILQPNLARLNDFMTSRPELCWVPPRGGNVAFPRVAHTTDTRPLTERLLREHDTAVVPGHFFESPAHIRVAFGCSEETLIAGLAALDAVLTSA